MVRYFGDYELIQEIARGGMGVVFSARQVSLNRIVALKMIALGHLASPLLVQRFYAEAEAAAKLDHPNIVPIFEIGEHQGKHYFSMKLIEGGSLAQRIAEFRLPICDLESGGNERLLTRLQMVDRQSTIAEFMASVARAVHYAHQRGILHRDLKPGNILLDRQGTPYVTDFGLAKALESEGDLTGTAATLGTPAYMSPEQASGETKHLTTACDVYSLGTILYELLAGRLPFRGSNTMETLRQVMEDEPKRPKICNPAIDADLETVCLKCLQKEPSNRYASADALAEDLGRWRRGEPILARPSTSLERATKWARRNPSLAALIVVSCLAFLGFTGMAVAMHYNARLQIAYNIADAARHDAVKARSREEGHRRRAEKAHYFRNISFAQREWELSHVAETEQLLDECPVEWRDIEWHYLKRQLHSELRTFKGHQNNIIAVALSSDGEQTASIDRSGSVRTWDRDGTELTSFQVSPGPISAASFDSEGTWVVTAETNGAVHVRALTPASQEIALADDSGKPRSLVTSVAMGSGPEKLVAVARSNNLIEIWEIHSRKLMRTLRGHAETVTCLAFSKDGSRLASGSGEPPKETTSGSLTPEVPGVVKIWALDSDAVTTLGPPASPVLSVTFRTDSNDIASGRHDGSVSIWLQAGADPHVLHTVKAHSDGVYSAVFAKDNRLLATGSADRTVRVWDIWKRHEEATYRGHAGGVLSLAFSSDGKTIASGSADQTVKVWDATNPQVARKITMSGPLNSVQFVADDSHILTRNGLVDISDRQASNVWQTSKFSGRPQSARPGSWSRYSRTSISLDGNLLFDGDAVWNVATGEFLKAFSGNAYANATFSPNSRLFAVAPANEVEVYDTGDWKRTSTLSGASNSTWALVFSSDSRLIASAHGQYGGARGFVGYPGEVRVWDTAKSQLLHLFSTRLVVWDVALSPNGRHLASAGGLYMNRTEPELGEVKIWDLVTGRLVHDLPVHNNCVFGLAFAPSGRRLATTGGNWGQRFTAHLKLWDVDAGTEVLVLRGHDRGISDVAFSPDGHKLASVGSGSALMIWNATPLAATYK